MHLLVKGFILSGISGLGWMGLFQLSNYLLTHYSKVKNWKISHHHIMNICEALVSGIQAIVSSVCGIIVVASCRHDVMWATNLLAPWYAWIGGSYFVYDTVAMYQVHLASLSKVPVSFMKRISSYLKRRTLLVIHHVVVATVLYPISARDVFPAYTTFQFSLLTINCKALDMIYLSLSMKKKDTFGIYSNHHPTGPYRSSITNPASLGPVVCWITELPNYRVVRLEYT
ncbi:TLC domain-containing protein 3A isoform X2 [Cherax quadricarinatus]|uniref:TLC domain-containing protein 3A isoform X2 n=1 Tax=Cherax quadricarinatus TaxID=27406 RepID=UPI00387E6FEE